MNDNIIDIAQLHGDEDEAYIRRLRQLTGKPIIKAFQVKSEKEIADAGQCSADYILLDSGAGTGTVFDWNILKKIDRPYFLAGGLFAGNVGKAVRELHPFAVDVSSGIETDRRKDKEKWRHLLPLSERKKHYDESKRTLRHSRWSVYP